MQRELSSHPTQEEQKSIEVEVPVSIHIPTKEEETEMWTKLFPNHELGDRIRGEDDLTLCLELGTKKLLLYTMGSHEFDTLIVNKEGVGQTGAVTKLFEKANEIMQDHTDKMDHAFLYDFATNNEKLIEWAKDAGNSIFHWHGIQSATPKNTIWIFSKKYLPKQI